MNRRIFLFLCLVLTAAFTYGGDVANYVNLGFSEDSGCFMFGYYGIDYKTSKPYAELYLVDVDSNNFVKDGTVSKTYDFRIQPGQDGSGALMNLLGENRKLTESMGVDHLRKGRIVYLLINGNEPKDNLEFRDFTRDTRYRLSLVQSRFGTENEPSASFHINLAVTDKSGATKAYTVGLPDYKRKDVLRYRIKQVVFSPDETSLVFVVEKEIVDGSGPSIRYMVETVSLD